MCYKQDHYKSDVKRTDSFKVPRFLRHSVTLTSRKSNQSRQVKFRIYFLDTFFFRFWILIFNFTVSFEFMRLLFVQEIIRLIDVGMRSKKWVCGRLLAGIAGSNPAGAWMSVSCDCCLLLCRGLCDGLFTRPGEPYRLCVCVCVCVCVCARNNIIYTYNK